MHRCRGLDGRTRPERIAAVLRAIDADIVALQEVVGAGPAGGGHAEEIGAALGMGWVMAPARQLRGHQFGNAVLSRIPITAASRTRSVVEDVRAAAHAARRRRVDGLHAARLQRAPRHRDPRAPPSGAAPRADRRATDTSSGPKLVLGDFNEWMRGLATNAAQREVEQRGPAGLPEAEATRAPTPASCRSCTSITSTTQGRSKSSASSCRGRGCRSSRRTICRSSPTFDSDSGLTTRAKTQNSQRPERSQNFSSHEKRDSAYSAVSVCCALCGD